MSCWKPESATLFSLRGGISAPTFILTSTISTPHREHFKGELGCRTGCFGPNRVEYVALGIALPHSRRRTPDALGEVDAPAVPMGDLIWRGEYHRRAVPHREVERECIVFRWKRQNFFPTRMDSHKGLR